MKLIIAKTAAPELLAALERRLETTGLRFERRHPQTGAPVFAVEGASAHAAESDERFSEIASWPEVERVFQTDRPYAFVSREFRAEDSVVEVGPLRIGDGRVTVFAGPCGVESWKALAEVAEAVRRAGGHGIRGGAYKPRTSPYSFQGLGEEGLQLLARARDEFRLPIVTEVMSAEEVSQVADAADMLQIGTRNMQNFRLLDAVGRLGKPVLLKRGLMATIDEFLGAAEYIRIRGNESIVLCERGIRTFEPRLRNTLDLGAVALLKRETHLPVIVDPSHGTGLSELVPDLSRAAVAVGADGLLIEVHADPEHALSDGRQSLRPDEFAALMKDLARLGEALQRPLAVLPERGRGTPAS